MREQPPGRGTRLAILAPATAVTVVLGLLVSVVPGLTQRTEEAAARFSDRAAYASLVLRGAAAPGATLAALITVGGIWAVALR